MSSGKAAPDNVIPAVERRISSLHRFLYPAGLAGAAAAVSDNKKVASRP